MNFYKRHLGDIAKACSHLSQGQMGAYDLLLDWLYSNEKPLPVDRGALYRIGRATTDGERDAVDTVLAEFFQLGADGYTQKRATEEIAKANAIAETNRRVAAEREERKRQRIVHEPLNESCTNRSTNDQPSQTPDTRHQTENVASRHTPPSAAGSGDRVGVFEGHENPVMPAPNPVAPFAILLNRAGYRCTTLTPDLVAYVGEGGTVEHLAQCLDLPECRGKPAAYPLRVARRELVDRAPGISPGARAGPSLTEGKTAQGIRLLEDMKHGLAQNRTADGVPETALLVAGTPARGGNPAGDR